MPQDLAGFREAIAAALAANPDIARYSGVNTVDSIIDAYTTNDWSNVTDISGMPFTPEQQQAAVAKAQRQLAPAYEAAKAYDDSVVTESLGQETQDLNQFREDQAAAFETDKRNADQSSADRGVLFAGSRFQKLNDLRDSYAKNDARKMGQVSSNIADTARDYQYKYGDKAARGIKQMYNVPGQTNFNANVAGGKVNKSNTLSSAYNPNKFNFQGTAPVSQSAQIQTRAAGLLGNTANKLTSTGYKNKL